MVSSILDASTKEAISRKREAALRRRVASAELKEPVAFELAVTATAAASASGLLPIVELKGEQHTPPSSSYGLAVFIDRQRIGGVPPELVGRVRGRWGPTTPPHVADVRWGKLTIQI